MIRTDFWTLGESYSLVNMNLKIIWCFTSNIKKKKKKNLHPHKQEEYTVMDENILRFTIIDSIMYLILTWFEFGLLAAK